MLSISIIPDLLTNESLLRGLWLCLTVVCLCIHVPIYHRLDADSRLCFCIYPNTNTPCQCSVHKTNWSTLYKKSLPGASHFEIKACLLVQPQFQECGRECECVARREKRNTEQVLVIFTTRESHWVFYLFPSIRRHLAGKVGGLD